MNVDRRIPPLPARTAEAVTIRLFDAAILLALRLVRGCTAPDASPRNPVLRLTSRRTAQPGPYGGWTLVAAPSDRDAAYARVTIHSA